MKHVSPKTTRSQAIRSLSDAARAVDRITPGFGLAVHQLLRARHLGEADGAQRRPPEATTRAERQRRADASRDEVEMPFKSFGEFLVEVAKASDPTSRAHPGLHRAPAGANETDPTGGGFLVADAWSDDLIYSVYGETVFAQFFDRRETSTQFAGVKIPGVDETSRAEGSRSGGFISVWQGESVPSTPSVMRSKLVEFVGKKLSIFTRATRELLNDAPMLQAYIQKGFAGEGSFKLELASLSGTGSGQPLGILNSPCLITVPKEIGQASATIVGENVSKMWSRLPAPCRKRAVWLINEDAEGQLEGISGASGAALYMPAGTGGNPYPLLKGRPVLVAEQCPALGTVGDIVLIDPSQYIVVDAGMNKALSVHARFDNDEVVFRFTWRIDGKGAYSTQITPYNGSQTRSPFIALGSR
jgi:HK97 family phage major capsid protein